MLRTRYGTEVHFVNTDLSGIQHVGPGKITFKDILITGQNVFAGAGPPRVQRHRGVLRRPWLVGRMQNVAIWGSGSFGFMALQGFLQLVNCWSVGNKTDGIFTFLTAGITTFGCGIVRQRLGGKEAGSSSTIYNDSSQSQYNGTYGAIAVATASCRIYASTVTGNATLDAYASEQRPSRVQLVGLCHVESGGQYARQLRRPCEGGLISGKESERK